MSHKTKRIFSCSCDPTKTMILTSLLEHLQAVHGIDENQRGARRAVERIAADDWHSITYEWVFPGGVTVFETFTNECDKGDPWWGMDDIDQVQP